MSENVKKFGSGAIITALLIFTLTGVFGWIGVTTAEVPALKAESKIQFANITKSIDRLADSSIETNKEIRRYSDQFSILAETMVMYGVQIEQLKEECSENHNDIKNCNAVWNTTK